MFYLFGKQAVETIYNLPTLFWLKPNLQGSNEAFR